MNIGPRRKSGEVGENLRNLHGLITNYLVNSEIGNLYRSFSDKLANVLFLAEFSDLVRIYKVEPLLQNFLPNFIYVHFIAKYYMYICLGHSANEELKLVFCDNYKAIWN